MANTDIFLNHTHHLTGKCELERHEVGKAIANGDHVHRIIPKQKELWECSKKPPCQGYKSLNG